MEKELFELLRLGLGNSVPEEEALSDFIMLNAEQWVRLGEMAQNQGVMGVLFDGVERLASFGFGATRGLRTEQKLEWIGEVLMVEQANQQQKVVMDDLAEKWTKEGCRVMVFKGQANGTFYPKPEHRNPGDIDCYLFENYFTGNDIARKVGAEVDEGCYKHSQIQYKGEMFESHQFFVTTRNGKLNKLMEKELEEALQVNNSKYSYLSEHVLCPLIQWTALFLTYHFCSHFF